MSKLWILLALVAAAVALPAQPDREAKDMKDLTDFRRAWTVSRNAIAAKVEQAMQPLQEWLEARWIKTKDLLKVMNLVNQVTRKKDKLN